MTPQNGLLPSGLYDQLPPQAEREMAALTQTMQSFLHFGYEQVSPPMLEFEDTLLAERGAALGADTFRIMDPSTGRMLALRADMTMQIARIATDRMKDTPRPLRLCYAGQTLRRNGHPLRAKRQFRQAGIELIGDGQLPLAADWEVMKVAALTVQSLGVTDLTLDINIPDLLPKLLDEAGMAPAKKQELIAELAQKDLSRLDAYGLDDACQNLLKALVEATGSMKHALPHVKKLSAVYPNNSAFSDAFDTLEKLAELLPDVALTLDLVEARGFEYHHRLSYCLLSKHSQLELGRGGRYEMEEGKEATGLTLYLDAIGELLPQAPVRPTVLVPLNTAPKILEKLHKKGFATVLNMGESSHTTHVLDGETPVPNTNLKDK